jgi:hypothetical protein
MSARNTEILNPSKKTVPAKTKITNGTTLTDRLLMTVTTTSVVRMINANLSVPRGSFPENVMLQETDTKLPADTEKSQETHVSNHPQTAKTTLSKKNVAQTEVKNLGLKFQSEQSSTFKDPSLVIEFNTFIWRGQRLLVGMMRLF